jgi:hypothetical protein
MQDPNPIVDEVRAIRDSIAKEYDYDIAKIAEAVRERQAKSGRTYVRLAPRTPSVVSPVKKAG